MLNHPLLSQEAEAGLARRIKRGDPGAQHELVRHNLRLAWFFAQQFGGRGSAEDFIGEAVVGLYKAAERFDPKQGRFAKYAAFYLRDAMRRQRRFEGYRSAAKRADRAKPAEAAWRWLERTGREVSDAEIAADLGWSERRLRSVLWRARPVSLEMQIGEHGLRLGETMVDEAAVLPDAAAAKEDLWAAARKALESLEPRMRAIIERRFGFRAEGEIGAPGTSRQHSLRAVGCAVGLSGERIRQLERDALIELRRMMAAVGP